MMFMAWVLLGQCCGLVAGAGLFQVGIHCHHSSFVIGYPLNFPGDGTQRRAVSVEHIAWERYPGPPATPLGIQVPKLLRAL